jgi:heme-degrading monooxygenase HmoA
MIARVWACRVPAALADGFAAHLQVTGVAETAATPGNLGAEVLRRTEGGTAHFLMISYWDGYASIRAFAGEDIERAWLHPDDTRFELDPDLRVSHYEVVRPTGA